MLKSAIKLFTKVAGSKTEVFYDAGLKKYIGFISENSSTVSFSVDQTKHFTPSTPFLKGIDDTLKNHVKDCPYIQALAMHQKNGFLNINDGRSGTWGSK